MKRATILLTIVLILTAGCVGNQPTGYVDYNNTTNTKLIFNGETMALNHGQAYVQINKYQYNKNVTLNGEQFVITHTKNKVKVKYQNKIIHNCTRNKEYQKYKC